MSKNRVFTEEELRAAPFRLPADQAKAIASRSVKAETAPTVLPKAAPKVERPKTVGKAKTGKNKAEAPTKATGKHK